MGLQLFLWCIAGVRQLLSRHFVLDSCPFPGSFARENELAVCFLVFVVFVCTH